MKTKDGYNVEPGQQITLYLGRTSVTGEIHHYGAEDWQLYPGGPLIKDLYYDQINALFDLGVSLTEQIKDIVKQMKEINRERETSGTANA